MPLAFSNKPPLKAVPLEQNLKDRLLFNITADYDFKGRPVVLLLLLPDAFVLILIPTFLRNVKIYIISRLFYTFPGAIHYSNEYTTIPRISAPKVCRLQGS
jgi:hypothetical protein